MVESHPTRKYSLSEVWEGNPNPKMQMSLFSVVVPSFVKKLILEFSEELPEWNDKSVSD